ncbi:RagB/SusD family nutrient uptake outer membrane protein [Hymenobacter sp. GOD-10R]|uniref:RagB/SusD family nutrient uptake outer membrane protein n=1 Tax=Hymenobacter sp. GOD-10R TaxID=3093922 RepID=UPI002D76C282|nr:RagB/SusD family nutrient uptake outer membrane protein [Hymenobacter sp. GOD-10R]WRQ29777.1 RagB/SusD family nutrient uptake outer membrane protein [Hymenobacter sp. GOD-10R]
MKKSFHIFFRASVLSGALLTVLPSCDVLQQDPPTAFQSTDEAFSTPARVELSMVGVYNDLQNAEFLGGRALIYSDVRSGDTDPASYFGAVPTFTQLSTDTYASNAWYGGYRSIFSANTFLQNIQAHPGIVPATQEAQYVGEAKFIRALTMLHLVNLYAQPYNFTADASHPGIVIQLTAPTNVDQAFDPTLRLPRSSVRDVYTQIINDLTDAIAALPVATTVNRATKGAAQALLARVYLYKGDYTNAAALSGQVITSAKYALNPDPWTVFGLQGPTASVTYTSPQSVPTYTTLESIFSVAMNANDNPNTNNAIGQHYGATRRADILITPFNSIATTVFPADDKRRLMIRPVKSGTTTNYYTQKFNAVDNWVPIVRYPEVLLTRAEALVRSTGVVSQEAISLLNQVRDRSKGSSQVSYTLASFISTQAFVDAVLQERRLELAFEGFRLPDLLRNKQGVPAHGGIAAIPYGDPRLVFPIPNQETLLNANLVQNPGY